ncbi:hypothetical protein L3Q67_39360 [Saccharothrix sp. AJ9571]|nr:hypothetical protein L3Q67_39360 [Saccharothrix sp. AJ9571]
MRTGPRLLTATLIAIGFAVSACGSDAPEPEPELIREYWASPAVENDRLPGYGGTPGDRQANLAAHFSPEQLVNRLLSVFECTEKTGTTSRGAKVFDTSCELDAATKRAVREAGGDPENLSARVVLVKHSDGALELRTLFLAGGKVIDGETYSGLEEFRAGHDLNSDDVLLAPRNLTQPDGSQELVTVYAHTPWAGWPWLFGGGGVLLLALVLLLFRRRVRR